MIVVCKTKSATIIGTQSYVAKKLYLSKSTLTKRLKKNSQYIDKDGNKFARLEGIVVKDK